MAEGLWGRLVHVFSSRVRDITTDFGSRIIAEGHGVGHVLVTERRSSPQSFLPGGAAASTVGASEMTDQLGNSMEAGAIPTAIAFVQILQTLKNDLGPDPVKFPLTGPPALAKALMAAQLQVPGLVNNEWSAVSTNFDSTTNGWIAALQAKQAALTAPPAAAPTPVPT